MREVTYTHKGWFGLCPIYAQRIDGEGFGIQPRFPFTDWLVDLSAEIYGFCFKLAMVEEPMWPIKITGELKKPMTVEYPHDS